MGISPDEKDKGACSGFVAIYEPNKKSPSERYNGIFEIVLSPEFGGGHRLNLEIGDIISGLDTGPKYRINDVPYVHRLDGKPVIHIEQKLVPTAEAMADRVSEQIARLMR
ncbi:Uncharacterised protein [uncultured archaeon]|nr:Uncharacterised protein [uncultured archaeon]